MVALAWSTGSCPDSPTCNIPESGIDVFDASGRLVSSMGTPDSPITIPQWSPDSRQIGWLSGRCELNECYNDAFRYRSVQGSEAVSSVPLPPWSEATWSTTNRLLVVASSTHWATVERVYSMALAGGDEQDATWNASDARRPIWSPDELLCCQAPIATRLASASIVRYTTRPRCHFRARIASSRLLPSPRRRAR